MKEKSVINRPQKALHKIPAPRCQSDADDIEQFGHQLISWQATVGMKKMRSCSPVIDGDRVTKVTRGVGE